MSQMPSTSKICSIHGVSVNIVSSWRKGYLIPDHLSHSQDRSSWNRHMSGSWDKNSLISGNYENHKILIFRNGWKGLTRQKITCLMLWVTLTYWIKSIIWL